MGGGGAAADGGGGAAARFPLWALSEARLANGDSVRFGPHDCRSPLQDSPPSNGNLHLTELTERDFNRLTRHGEENPGSGFIDISEK